jgi:hypothetical protein
LITQNIKPSLRIGWATHEAAKYACENWHYSKCVPKSKLVKFGVWEGNQFKGVIIYGCGATSDLVKKYGLKPEQGCELVRIALRDHFWPVSKMLAITLRMLKKEQNGLRLIVSFADPEQGHHGGIYQATNWIFSGYSQASDEYLYKGKRWQGRSFRNSFKGMEKHPDVKVVRGSSKIRYLYPLDDDIRDKIAKLAKKYPKRVEHESNASDFQSEESGPVPTNALHINKEPSNG